MDKDKIRLEEMIIQLTSFQKEEIRDYFKHIQFLKVAIPWGIIQGRINEMKNQN